MAQAAMTGPSSAGAPSAAPVFIVGLPRSGTTLMAVCLDRHPAMYCGPETHLFARLATPAGQAALDPARWPDAAVDFVATLATAGDADPGMAPLDRDRIRAALAGRDASVAAVLESLVATRAAEAHKRRWVEKTPRHMDFLARIRQAWPDASVIHMVRDPRARAVSMSSVPFGPSSQVQNLLEGVRRDRRARPDLDADPRLITVRLEDLTSDPPAELGRVCAFLGEAYAPVMLEPAPRSSAVGAREWWKHQAVGAISAGPVDAWRDTMEPAVQRFASLYCADQIERYGYPDPRPARASLVVVPAGARVIRRHQPAALELARSDIIVRGLPAVSWSHLRRLDTLAYWGRPGQLLPGKGRSPTGWRGLGLIGLDLAVRWVRRRPASWVVEDTGRRREPSRPQERWLARLLRVLARRVTPDELLRVARDQAPAGSAQPPLP
jgi:hypothetical protein